MRAKLKTFLVFLIALTLCFIWGHSLMSREDSANESGWITELLTPLLEVFVGKGNVTNDHFVRKLAHFCEYSLLGAELFLFFFPGGKTNRQRNFRYCLRAEAHVIFVAVMDETLQLFSDRGSQIQDVWLDSVSGAVGIFFVVLLIVLFSRRKPPNSET